VAEGEKIDRLPVNHLGHAIEFRINAEDPDQNFLPSPGKILSLNFPGGLPVSGIDSHYLSLLYNSSIL